MLAALARVSRHWFTPHTTNNFRARLLHNSGIFFVIGLVLTGSVFIRLLDRSSLHILGFTSSVTIDDVFASTNEERIAEGLKPLGLNSKLSDAARRKAADMFAENYWAHNSPSGYTPWHWFQEVGYNYSYAGENLAKDFGNTSRLMSAWMASPTHRDNILNSHYTEIGIAVVPGSLLGADTVLVVQEFGSTAGGSVAPGGQNTVSPKTQGVATAKVPTVPASTPAPTLAPPLVAQVAAPAPGSAYNSFNVQRLLNLATTALFLLALVIDLALSESRNLSRRVGKNWAHIVFINVILLVTTIVNAGRIL